MLGEQYQLAYTEFNTHVDGLIMLLSHMKYCVEDRQDLAIKIDEGI